MDFRPTWPTGTGLLALACLVEVSACADDSGERDAGTRGAGIGVADSGLEDGASNSMTSGSGTQGSSDSGGASGVGESSAADETSGGDDSGGDTDGDDDHHAKPPRTRRLSNHELRNSYTALLGFEPDALSLLPPDGDDIGFERLGDHQSVSRIHLDGYWAAAVEASQTLADRRGYDELSDACSDAIMPPATAALKRVSMGSELSLNPVWAIRPDDASPDRMFLTYAPNARAVAGVTVASPGTYDLELHIDVQAHDFPHVDIELDGGIVATDGDLKGPQVVRSRIEIAEAGPHTIAYQFDATGTGEPNNVSVRFDRFSIEGPIDTGAEIFAAQRLACARSLVETVGARAFRRPLAPSEVDDRLGRFTETAELAGDSAAFATLMQSLLISPYFTYQVEIGAPVPDRPELHQLDAWELAARLSYGLCEAPPDEALRASAEDGSLLEGDELRRHARRLFEGTCGVATVRRFFDQWLGLGQLYGLNKDPEVFPDFNDEVRLGLVAEVDAYIEGHFWQAGANYSEFLSSRLAWPDPRSEHLYGLQGTDPGQATMLPPERAGLLSSPAFLAVSSPFSSTSPVDRGVLLLEAILCEELPPPPPELDIVPPLPDPNLTTRERWAAHSQEPACAGCHSLIDPVGFLFEEFDALGRHRSHENGRPVDASGGVPLLGIADGQLEGVADMMRELAGRSELDLCLARQWLRFVLARLDHREDEASLERMALELAQGSMREAFLSIVDSESFRMRLEQPE